MSVFISHALNDRASIRKIILELKSRGILTDTEDIVDLNDLDPGSSVRVQVRQAIERASKVIVVWSKAAAASGFVNYETGMADALGKPIVVVVPKGEASHLSLPVEHRQIIELESVR